MPGEHQTDLGVRILDRNDVAVQVGGDLVRELLQVVADNLLHRLLEAGRAGRFQDLLEEFERGSVHPCGLPSIGQGAKAGAAQRETALSAAGLSLVGMILQRRKAVQGPALTTLVRATYDCGFPTLAPPLT